VPLIRLYA
jgi:DNA-directed RNA polymerase specialized sigma24 family protein